jgi:hypothetical protein
MVIIGTLRWAIPPRTAGSRKRRESAFAQYNGWGVPMRGAGGPKARMNRRRGDYVYAVSRHKVRLEKNFIVPVMPWERRQHLADKQLQPGLARRAGIDTPITAFVHGSSGLFAAADVVQFPALLKPADPLALRRRTRLKAVVVENRERLDEACERFSLCGPLLVLEIIPGGRRPDPHRGRVSRRPIALRSAVHRPQPPAASTELRRRAPVRVSLVARDCDARFAVRVV